MTDPNEKVASEALCRNHLSGFAEVCAGVCGGSTVPGQPHPCEHALTVWRSDAQEILRALLARVDPKALEELDLASRAIERARALLAGEDLVHQIPWQTISDIARPVRGCATDEQYQDLTDRIEKALQAAAVAPAVRDALDHLHAMAPGIRDLDALDAVEKDDESMRSAVRDVTLREVLEKLYRAYVSLLELGRNRIIDLGGTCDAVDVMEKGDPALVAARAALSPSPQADK